MFKNTDLQTGDVIVRKNGCVGIVIKTAELASIVTLHGYTPVSFEMNKLKNAPVSEETGEFDIIEVWRPTCSPECQFEPKAYKSGDLKFSRPVQVEMTLKEIEERLGFQIKIIPESKKK